MSHSREKEDSSCEKYEPKNEKQQQKMSMENIS